MIGVVMRGCHIGANTPTFPRRLQGSQTNTPKLGAIVVFDELPRATLR
jgi:hypothetical protein